MISLIIAVLKLQYSTINLTVILSLKKVCTEYSSKLLIVVNVYSFCSVYNTVYFEPLQYGCLGRGNILRLNNIMIVVIFKLS